MQSYIDTSLSSMRSYVDEQNQETLNTLSKWKSNMEAIIGSMQQDVPLDTSVVPCDKPNEISTVEQIGCSKRLIKEKKNKGKQIHSSSSSDRPLEDYPMQRYIKIRNFIAKNQSG